MSDPAQNQEFGDRLREALSRANISQVELGRRIGAHPNQVNSWVNGRRDPSFHYLAALAPVLKVKIDWLVLGADSSPAPSPAGDRVSERVRSLGSELIELVELARRDGD